MGGKSSKGQDLEKLIPSLQTGDIVLMSGKTSGGFIIRTFEGSPFSHIGLVYRRRNEDGIDQVCVMEASTNHAGLVDVETGEVSRGVELLDLREKLLSGWYDAVAFRQLIVPDDVREEIAPLLYEFLEKTRGLPYEQSMLEMAKSAYDKFLGENHYENLSSIFCSEFVGAALMHMGLLPNRISQDRYLPSNEYSPADFTSRRSLPLQRGAMYGPEIDMYVPPGLKKLRAPKSIAKPAKKKNKVSAAEALLEPVAPAEDATALWKALCINLFRRPTMKQIRTYWNAFDANENGRLERSEATEFLQRLHADFGEEGTTPDMAFLARVEHKITGTIAWETVRRVLVGATDYGVCALVVTKLRGAFKSAKCEGPTGLLTKAAARDAVAVPLLARNNVHAGSKLHKRAMAAVDGLAVDPVPFEEFVRVFGPLYQETVLLHDHENISGLHARVDPHKDRMAIDGHVKSFAPERLYVDAKFLIDGQETFAEMAQLIESATTSIMCSFWRLSPELAMVRTREAVPAEDSHMGTLLRRKAEQGVRVYVLLFDDLDAALDLFPEENKAYLEGLHENISVIIHPEQFPILWSHHQKFLIVDEQVAVLGGLDFGVGRFDNCEHVLFDETGGNMFPGIDYVNAKTSGYPSRDAYSTPRTDYIDRSTMHRFPWHDIDVRVNGLAAFDVLVNFVQRWNDHRPRLNRSRYPELKAPKESSYTSDVSTGTHSVQIVRSACEWSIGHLLKSRVEVSLYESYIRAINAAEHYIYIEQQFFISSTAGGGVQNRVAEAIYQRIKWAVQNSRTFRVILVIPFPEETGLAAREIVHWTWRTIFRGGQSLMERVEELVQGTDRTIEDYLVVCSLRTWQKNPKDDAHVATEQVFVHAKVMIVDDRVAIVSSANVNDRSMIGSRDSELGAVIRDDKMTETLMDGGAASVGTSIKAFRTRLWLEKLGLCMCSEHEKLIEDPVVDAVYRDIWLATARKNTIIFNNVFPFIPSNQLRTPQQEEAAPKAPREVERLADVSGSLCLSPRFYMADDKSNPIEWIIETFRPFRRLFQ